MINQAVYYYFFSRGVYTLLSLIPFIEMEGVTVVCFIDWFRPLSFAKAARMSTGG